MHVIKAYGVRVLLHSFLSSLVPRPNYYLVISQGTHSVEARGGAVVEALRYKPDGREIDSRWCHWNFSLT
jgi:hypothetical protein